MGVSASHVDWTMVPYVRKSFMKHYITAVLKDSEDFLNLNLMDMLFNEYDEVIKDDNKEYRVTRNEFDDWIDKNKNKVLKITGLTEQDFYLDNKNLNKKYYQQALFDTIKETQQAVEGMYHNLNYWGD